MLVHTALLAAGSAVQPRDVHLRQIEAPEWGSECDRSRDVGQHSRRLRLAQHRTAECQVAAALVEGRPVDAVDVCPTADPDPRARLDQASDGLVVVPEGLGLTTQEYAIRGDE